MDEPDRQAIIDAGRGHLIGERSQIGGGHGASGDPTTGKFAPHTAHGDARGESGRSILSPSQPVETPASELDAVLPPPKPLVNVVTGEVVDRDSLMDVTAALASVDAFIEEKVYGAHRAVFRCRDELRARQGELKPTDLPARRYQTKRQQEIERCPRCRTRIPRVVIEDDD
jgi:hypothetical protein